MILLYRRSHFEENDVWNVYNNKVPLKPYVEQMVMTSMICILSFYTLVKIFSLKWNKQAQKLISSIAYD